MLPQVVPTLARKLRDRVGFIVGGQLLWVQQKFHAWDSPTGNYAKAQGRASAPWGTEHVI